MKKSRNIIIGALLIAVVSMAIGYAALAQQLTINGTANIALDWDVEFTAITLTDSDGAKEVIEPSYTATTATFEVDLTKPGAYADYDIKIENLGSIDAYLAEITGVDTANAATPSEIQYTLTGVQVNDDLAAEGTATAHVHVEWVDDGQDHDPSEYETKQSKTATIVLNYKQKTA